jgi:hypothetical protein
LQLQTLSPIYRRNSGGIFHDSAKPFDSINYEILLIKLQFFLALKKERQFGAENT